MQLPLDQCQQIIKQDSVTGSKGARAIMDQCQSANHMPGCVTQGMRQIKPHIELIDPA